MMTKKFNDDLGGAWESYGKSSKSSSGSVKIASRCYESHPALKLVKDGKDYFIYGGSCSYPVVKDADVYIALDGYSPSAHSEFPWNPKPEHEALHVHFPITDMHVPSDTPEAMKMVTWICNQLQLGQKVHLGCIGGHGRTGTILAAVVAEFMGEKDAITYVRKNYCPKAVESTEQIKWLGKHYGIKSVAGSKAHLSPSLGTWDSVGGMKNGKGSPAVSKPGKWTAGGSVVDLNSYSQRSLNFSNASKTISPVKSKRCLWNEPEKSI
jgi:hypothetical protein